MNTNAQARVRSGLRASLVVVTAIVMATALYGGMLRIGVPLPSGLHLAELHGPLMIAGVFGTLISLERAVALGWRWPYLAPCASALGAVALLAGLPVEIGATLFVISAVMLSAACLRILLLQPALFTFALVAGAGAEAIGNVLWLTGSAPADAAAWWLAFLVCTIAAERLELSRVLQHGRDAAHALAAAIILMIFAASIGILSPLGRPLLGISFLAITGWLLRFDIATRTVGQTGRTRFFASAMLAGYFWLGISGLLLVLAPEATFAYDMTMHSVLIGFVLSMVFGHALIILPAVTGLKLMYHPALYLPLALLHGSVALRILGGLLEDQAARMGSGILTVASLLTFGVVLTLVSRPSGARS